MATLTPEQRDFLLYGTRTGKLATMRKDGYPHVVPVWFTLDDHSPVFTTGESTVKAANLRRNEHVAFCVDDENPPYGFILIEGIAKMEKNSPSLKFWATRIAERYMGLEQAEDFGLRNSVDSELLVHITLTKVIFNPDVTT